MIATSERFVTAIALEEVDPQVFDVAFQAIPQYVPWPKAYGGDMVAQSLAAATATVASDRVTHSMHSYFLRPVDIAVPVRYEVELLRDGRNYSTRQVRGYQSGKAVIATLLSFHTGAESEEFQQPMPLDPPPAPPESLPSSADVLADREGDAASYWASGRSFDMRHVPGPIYIENDGIRTPNQAVWVRSFDALEDDPVMHQVALAYVCDYTILEPALRALGLHWSHPGLVTASLDHSMWFHRPARIDEWLLYAQEAVSVAEGRGLATGRFFDRSGRLIATVAQEGLIAVPRPARPADDFSSSTSVPIKRSLS